MVAAVLAFALTASLVYADDWPQLQHNAAHTGHTSDQPAPPFKVKWTRGLEEPTNTAAQPIVADGKLFVGTNWGYLHALNRETGRTLWSFQARGPIVSTPAYSGGLVFATSMDGRCYAVRAKDGEQVWSFQCDEGIWASPVVSDGVVFIAGRDAHAYALDAKTGKALWRTPVGGMVMATPAYRDGVLYVGGGDNHIYALDGKTGALRWKSPKLPGMAIRDYWLVAAGDSVICTTQLVYGAHPTYNHLEREVMRLFREQHDGKMLVQDRLIERIRQWYEAHPHRQTFHVLSAETGKPKFTAPIVPVHGGGCVGPLPAVAPDGKTAYVMYANVRLEASGWAFPGRLDLDTGKLEPLIKGRYWIDAKEWEWQAKPGEKLDRSSPFATGFCVNDQSWGVSLAGGQLLTVRDPGWPESEGAYGLINLKTGKDQYLTADRAAIKDALRGGSFGGAFHATCSPMIVSGKQVFHKAARNVIICFEGQ